LIKFSLLESRPSKILFSYKPFRLKSNPLDLLAFYKFGFILFDNWAFRNFDLYLYLIQKFIMQRVIFDKLYIGHLFNITLATTGYVFYSTRAAATISTTDKLLNLQQSNSSKSNEKQIVNLAKEDGKSVISEKLIRNQNQRIQMQNIKSKMNLTNGTGSGLKKEQIRSGSFRVREMLKRYQDNLQEKNAGKDGTEILEMFMKNKEYFLASNFSHCLTLLAKQVRSKPQIGSKIVNDQRFDLLCSRMSQEISSLNPIGISSSLWALSILRPHFSLESAQNFQLEGRPEHSQYFKLVDKLLELSINHSLTFNAQNVSNVLWAIPRLTPSSNSQVDLGREFAEKFLQVGPSVFNNLKEKAKPQELSNIVWSYGKMNLIFEDNQEFFNLLGNQALEAIHQFKPQELMNLTWGFATMKYPVPNLFSKIISLPQSFFEAFNPQELSMLCWSYAKMNYSPGNLFPLMADLSLKKLRDFSPQGLSLLCWSFAKLSINNQKLFSEVATLAIERIEDFKPQELGALVYAFGASGTVNKPLFDKIEQALYKSPESFNFLELIQILWGFNVLQAQNPKLCNVISKQLIKLCDSSSANSFLSLSARNVSVFANTLKNSKIKSPLLLNSLVKASNSKLSEFSTKQLSEILVIFDQALETELESQQQTQTKDFFSSASQELLNNRDLQTFSPQELTVISNVLSNQKTEVQSQLFFKIGEIIFQKYSEFTPESLRKISDSFDLVESEQDISSLRVAMSANSDQDVIRFA